MRKHDFLYEFIQLTRPLQHQIEAAVSGMLSETPVTVRMRAVLEMLEKNGPATVPTIGRHMGIQRQYVQVMMNEVEAARLVTRQPNPAHKRSTLFELSDSGRDIIHGIRRAEMHVIESLARSVSLDEVEKAHHVIEHLLKGFTELNDALKD